MQVYLCLVQVWSDIFDDHTVVSGICQVCAFELIPDDLFRSLDPLVFPMGSFEVGQLEPWMEH